MVAVLIDLFKYLGIIIGSISGIIGLFVEFRNKKTGRITDTGEEIRAYKERLASDCRIIADDLTTRNQTQLMQKYGISAARIYHDTVNEIKITDHTSLFPSYDSERVAWESVSYTSLSVSFYKDSVPVSQLAAAKPDLTIPYISTGVNPQFMNGPHVLQYDIKANKLYLWAYNIFTDPRSWKKSGKILSTIDFSGASMVTSLPGLIGAHDTSIDRKVLVVRKSFELLSLQFNMSDGVLYRMTPKQMIPVNKSGQLPEYLYRFPKGTTNF